MFDLTEQEVKAFVGSKADYYLKSWQVGSARRAGGFNGAAFLLSGLWLPYRKMYLPATIFFGLIVIESIAEEVLFVGVLGKEEAPAAIGRLVGLVAAITCGTFGNQWYLTHARKVIEEVRSQGLPEEEYLNVLSKRGGTNLLASVGFFVVFIVAAIAILIVLNLLFETA